MKRVALICAGLLFSAPSLAADFASGQRWSCVTDQGADAYMSVHQVVGKDITYSWGVLDPDSKGVFTLCNQKGALSADEMSEFCRLLGEEFSEGHVLLQKGCAQ